MHRSLIAIALITILSTACGVIAEPTATPTPSETPTPSTTPTSTRTPTATPDIPATETRVAERTAEFIDTYAPVLNNVGYDIGQGQLLDHASSDTILDINAQSNRRTWDTFIAEDVGNFVLHTNVTWNTSTGLSGCGVYFHGDGDFSGGQYVNFRFYRLSGLPFWSMIYVKFNTIQATLGGPSGASAIEQSDGATNQVVIVVDHPNVTVYMNGDRIGAGTLPAASTEGEIAMSLSHESGQTRCQFSDIWVWELP